MKKSGIISRLSELINRISSSFIDLTINKKLIYGFGFVIVLGLITSTVHWFMLDLQSKSYSLSKNAGKITADLRLLRQDEKNFMLRDDPKYAKLVKSALNQLHKVAEQLDNKAYNVGGGG
ncbi:MAG: hypothetical protein WDZ47_12440, partial [Bacteroidales bacterium]